jgi:hypothetical protein
MITEDTIQAAYKSMSSALTASAEARPMLERAITARRRIRAGVGFGAATLAVVGAVGIAGVISRQGVDSMHDPTPAAPAGHASVVVPPVHIMIQGRSEFGGNLPVPRNPFGPYQNELMRAAERYDNYSGSRIIYQPQALIIYGTGQPSPEVASIINHPPKDVTARWMTVPYSKLELERAGNQLAAAIPRTMVIRYAHDYGSIIVGVHGLPTTEAGLQPLRDLAAGITDIPVILEDSEGGMILPYTPSN